MEMNLQTIYFMVGVAGLVLAAGFALSAIVYFVKADIRGVRADLSGKARQAGLSERAERKNARAAKNVLTKEDEWKGRISQGDLAAKDDDACQVAGASDALTDPGESMGDPPSEVPSKQESPAVPFTMIRSVVAVHSTSAVDAQGNEVEPR